MRALVSVTGLFVLIAITQATAQISTPSATNADRSAEVKLFQPSEVAASFDKSGTLVQGTSYNVIAAKRVEPGEAEVHTRFTDVFYIVEGTATIVVGGQLAGQKSTDPDELRGTSIQGGQAHQLTAGSVVIIPAGIPHWINSVSPPFHYFVVKVAATAP
jgi:mannose-6-phosphate isomerase-like protein (cupin superfamily)